jgi:phenylpyruvate tautomerase PptA (4-oxalocrotonate tautomerase family)
VEKKHRIMKGITKLVSEIVVQMFLHGNPSYIHIQGVSEVMVKNLRMKTTH